MSTGWAWLLSRAQGRPGYYPEHRVGLGIILQIYLISLVENVVKFALAIMLRLLPVCSTYSSISNFYQKQAFVP